MRKYVNKNKGQIRRTERWSEGEACMWTERDASARSRKSKIAYSFHPLSYSVFPPSLPSTLSISLSPPPPLSLSLSLSVRLSVSCAFSLTLSPTLAHSTVLNHLCECDRRRSFGQAYYLPLSKMLETLIQTHTHTHTNTHVHSIKHTRMWGCGAKNITHAFSSPYSPVSVPTLSIHTALSFSLSQIHTHTQTQHTPNTQA